MGTRDWQIGNRPVAILAGCLLAVAITLVAVRIVVRYQTPGPFDPQNQGLCDFHNGIYFPARAVLAGQSPYGQAYADSQPVARQIPFFSPAILVLHAPLAVLPLHVGETLNFLLQLTMIVAIAILVAQAIGYSRRVDAILVLAAAMMLTRAGHVTVFNGYFTFQLVLATFLSIHWGDRRPIASGLALLVVSAKPTYLLPLGFLLLARGQFRSLAIGAVLSILGAALPLAWIAWHEGNGDLMVGAKNVIAQIGDAQALHRSMLDESPIHSWTRLDLFAVLCKWWGADPGEAMHVAAMMVVLAIPMALLARRAWSTTDDGLAGVTGGLITTATVVSLYHQSYDWLLVVPVLAALIAGSVPAWRACGAPIRWTLIGLLTLPAINLFSTRSFLIRFDLDAPWDKILTSINGVALALALVIIAIQASRRANDSPLTGRD